MVFMKFTLPVIYGCSIMKQVDHLNKWQEHSKKVSATINCPNEMKTESISLHWVQGGWNCRFTTANILLRSDNWVLWWYWFIWRRYRPNSGAIMGCWSTSRRFLFSFSCYLSSKIGTERVFLQPIHRVSIAWLPRKHAPNLQNWPKTRSAAEWFLPDNSSDLRVFR